jgi:hypothetical protein
MPAVLMNHLADGDGEQRRAVWKNLSIDQLVMTSMNRMMAGVRLDKSRCGGRSIRLPGRAWTSGTMYNAEIQDRLRGVGMKRVPRILRACAILAIGLSAASILAAHPAGAASTGNCSSTYNGIWVCVYADRASNESAAFIQGLGTHSFHSPTVALLQCSGTGANCKPIAARSDIGHILFEFDTSTKPYSPGHVYQAVGSWIDDTGHHSVAVKSPFVY